MENLPNIVYGIFVIVVLIGLVIYVFFWPEKRCPKCHTPLVRFMPPGSDYFQVGCPTCNIYDRET